MNLWNGLKTEVRENGSLAGLTSFGSGATARYLFRPESVGDMTEALKICARSGISVKILAGGTNVIIASNVVEAMVILIRGSFLTSIEYDGAQVTSGAGVPMGRLVSEMADHGLAGLEFMAGVPGTVGGAAAGGAGTKGGRFLDVSSAIQTIDSRGATCWAGPGRADGIILACRLTLMADRSEGIRGKIEENLAYRGSTQPKGVSTAGCLFRNPEGNSAGRLIEEAGLKGLRVGGAEISRVHANFLVNRGEAVGSDVLRIIERIREEVRSRTGVDLELEADIW